MVLDSQTLPETFGTWPETAQAEYLEMQQRAVQAEGTIQTIRDQFTQGILAMKEPDNYTTVTWQAIILRALNDVYKEAATTLNLQEVLNKVTKIGAEFLGATSAYFCDWDDDNYRATVMAEYISQRATAIEKEASHIGNLAQRDYAFREKITREQGYWMSHFDDADMQASERAMFEHYDIKTIMYVPLFADNREMMGYLAIWETRQKREFNKRQIEYAMLIAEQVAGTFRNVKLHHALEQSEARYRLLMNTMREGLVQVDANGTIEYANDPFGRLIGANSIALKGQNLDDLWAERACNIEANEVQITHSNGQTAYVQISHSPIINPNGQQVGTVYVYTDVSERRVAEKSALALGLERERVQLLTQFVQDTSHEFYTPLSVIGTRAYLLQRKVQDKTVQEYVTIIREQTETIQSLVKALVTMTKLDSMQELTLTPGNLNEIIIACVNSQRTTIDNKSQHIQMNLEPRISIIDCNAEKIGIAIQNVLENAIRYTPEHGNVAVRLYQHHDDYVLEVEDDGAGMAEDVKQAVFQRFYREDEARSTRGFGLGLAITKRIIDLHDAHIEVESAAGAGTLIRMIFPVTTPQPVATG